MGTAKRERQKANRQLRLQELAKQARKEKSKRMGLRVGLGIVAVIASYILNREWSFRDRGGRERHHEALLFFAISGVGVLLSMAPLWASSYIFGLRVPNVSLTVENIADFISAYIIGNLLQMAFRFWAFRRWVFPDQINRDPELALESALTGGGFVEVAEDEFEARHANVTPLRRRRAQRQTVDAELDNVSKSS